MYYLARDRAMNNNHTFHLAAILKRGKSIIRVGVNSDKTNPRFARKYKNGEINYHLHAEMDVLCSAQPGDSIIVVRFAADGSLTMAKPCEHCQRFLAEAGIFKVYYTDWNGEYQKLTTGL